MFIYPSVAQNEVIHVPVESEYVEIGEYEDHGDEDEDEVGTCGEFQAVEHDHWLVSEDMDSSMVIPSQDKRIKKVPF